MRPTEKPKEKSDDFDFPGKEFLDNLGINANLLHNVWDLVPTKVPWIDSLKDVGEKYFNMYSPRTGPGVAPGIDPVEALKAEPFDYSGNQSPRSPYGILQPVVDKYKKLDKVKKKVLGWILPDFLNPWATTEEPIPVLYIHWPHRAKHLRPVYRWVLSYLIMDCAWLITTIILMSKETTLRYFKY